HEPIRGPFPDTFGDSPVPAGGGDADFGSPQKAQGMGGPVHMSASPYRIFFLAWTMAVLAVVAAHGQIKLSPRDDGSGGSSASQGAADPADAAEGAGPDLLSQYEKSPGSGSRWLAKLKGWLGAGGAPAEQAAEAYAAGDYDLALRKYAEAGLDNPESQALAYNAGNAHYRKKKYD